MKLEALMTIVIILLTFAILLSGGKADNRAYDALTHLSKEANTTKPGEH